MLKIGENSSSDGDNHVVQSKYKKNEQRKKRAYSTKELRNIRSRAYLQRVKQNPVLYQCYLEKKRAYQRRKRLRKKEQMDQDPMYAAEVKRKASAAYYSHKAIKNEGATEDLPNHNQDYVLNERKSSDDFTNFIQENSQQLNVDINNLTTIDLLKCKQIFIAKQYLQRVQSSNILYESKQIKREAETNPDVYTNNSNVMSVESERLEELESKVNKHSPAIKCFYKSLKTKKNTVYKLKRKLDHGRASVDADSKEYLPSNLPPKRKYIKHIKQEHPEMILPPKEDTEFVKVINELKALDEDKSDQTLTDDNLSEKVKQFMDRDDISLICESVPENNVDIPTENKTRYVLHMLSLLHQRFSFEEDIECSFLDFQKSVPSYIIRPNAEESSLCPCPICINPELKFCCLISIGVLKFDNPDLEEIIQNNELFAKMFEQLEEHAQSRQSVTFSVWSKNDNGTINSIKRKVTEYLSSLIKKFKDEVLQLQSHIQRVITQYRSVRTARKMARNSDTSVAIHIDWVSKAKIYQTHNQSGVIFSEKSITVHAGIIWSKDNVSEAAGLSDSKDITSVAAWVFIQKILKSYVEMGIKKFYMISSGPVCLYKNKNSFYLMKLFIKEFDVEFRWTYLEPWHGHGSATNVGRNLKNIIEDLTTSRPATLIVNAHDVLDLVQNDVDMTLHVYNEDDIAACRMHLPALKIIPGSVNFSDVVISNNEFLVKHSSDDELFTCISGRMIKYGNTPWNAPPSLEFEAKPNQETLPPIQSNVDTEVDVPPVEEPEFSYDHEINSPSNIEIVTNE